MLYDLQGRAKQSEQHSRGLIGFLLSRILPGGEPNNNRKGKKKVWLVVKEFRLCAHTWGRRSLDGFFLFFLPFCLLVSRRHSPYVYLLSHKSKNINSITPVMFADWQQHFRVRSSLAGVINSSSSRYTCSKKNADSLLRFLGNWCQSLFIWAIIKLKRKSCISILNNSSNSAIPVKRIAGLSHLLACLINQQRQMRLR